jgi:hypothetical protein
MPAHYQARPEKHMSNKLSLASLNHLNGYFSAFANYPYLKGAALPVVAVYQLPLPCILG